MEAITTVIIIISEESKFQCPKKFDIFPSKLRQRLDEADDTKSVRHQIKTILTLSFVFQTKMSKSILQFLDGSIS